MNDSEAGPSSSATEDFDVFLNHRGPDVKATFVAHLEDALRHAGFRPFLDARSLMKGNPALESIDQAVAMAKVHIAVVSKGYAASKFCLNELVAMVRSGKPVIPVFYDVEPVDLRRVENGPFAEAFERHKSRGRTEKKLEQWRDALRALAGLTGFCLAHYGRDEAMLKQEVVNEVSRLTPSSQRVEVEAHTVGVEGPAQFCMQKLDDMGAGVGILGLVGMGGVGKTTLARELYNRFVAEKKFRCMTFLEVDRDSLTPNVMVRPTWARELRKQLLWDLLRVHDNTPTGYRSWFEKVSTAGPVLVVVDDVHTLGQFEALIPFACDLHPGSRIIITSRDRSVLNNVAGRAKVDQYLFDVSTLGSDESNELFNWHAFQEKEAPDGYKDVAKDVVEACGGLPLALKVIGSSLYDKRLDGDLESIWPEARDALRGNSDVMSVLRWSYDNLPKWEKSMFLDVTCMLYKQSVKEALACWRSCKGCASCGGILAAHTSLRNLVNKNMVTLGDAGAKFKVHDLLIELGQEIGMEAGTHIVKDGFAEAALDSKQRLLKTIALNLGGSRKQKFETGDFEHMPNLHYLVLPDGCSVCGKYTRMSREIRWLQWRNMPLPRIPTSFFNLSRVISLDFSGSTNLASLWTERDGGWEGCPSLLRLNLSGCSSITRLPNSIGQSSRLEDLNMWGCLRLEKFPKSVEQLKALVRLNLGHCTSLKALPDTVGQLSQLVSLDLAYCRKLNSLPESLGQLKALVSLSLEDCTSLKALPDSIGALSQLRRLSTIYCTSLVMLPPSMRLLSGLKQVFLEFSPECQTFSPRTVEAWTHLHDLVLFNCGRLGSVVDYGALESLGSLHLSDNTLIELPESIGLLMGLQELIIRCERLRCLPESIGDLKMLYGLHVLQCNNLMRLPNTLGALTNLNSLSVCGCPMIRRLPSSTGQLSRLEMFQVSSCKNLQKLPTSIRRLGRLRKFHLDDCGSLEALGIFRTLQGLPIWGSTSTTKLPACLGITSTLLVCKPEAFYRHDIMVGTSQVLEQDESGSLTAYYDESSERTRLL